MRFVTFQVKAPKRSVEYVVYARNDAMYMGATEITAALRNANKAVDMMLEPCSKVRKAFDYADRVGAKRMIFVAEDEYNQGNY